MAAEISKSMAEQTAKEKELLMSAEAEKAAALEEIKKQNEALLKDQLSAAENQKRQHLEEMEAKLKAEQAR